MQETIFGMSPQAAEQYYNQPRGLTDYLPNVFGYAPVGVAGLLGADQTAALNKQANVSGLLGAAIALAAGMSRSGEPRSAAQNILGALGAGVGAAQGQYQGAFQNLLNQQALAARQAQAEAFQARANNELMEGERQKQAITAAMELPEVQANPRLRALMLTNPVEGLKLLTQQKERKSTVIGRNLVDSVTGEIVTTVPNDVEMLTPDRATKMGLPANAGTWVIKDGVPSIVNGTENPTSYREYTLSGSNLPFDAWLLRGKQSAAPKVSVNTGDPTAVAGKAMEVNDKFAALTKQDREIASRYSQLLSAYNNPAMGGTGDAAMIYSVAKILDPDGAVREGDVAMVAGSPSFPDQLRQIAQRFISNKKLLPEQRDQLMSLGYEIMAKKAKTAERTASTYRGFAKTFGVSDPDTLIRSPYADLGKPEYRVVKFNGKEVRARYSPSEGKYFVQSGSQFIPIED